MIFVNADNAEFMPGLLRVKARVQSQQNRPKLRHMLHMLEKEGPNPIYNELLRSQSTSFKLRRFLLDAEAEAKGSDAPL